jgi:hypothetical protein
MLKYLKAAGLMTALAAFTVACDKADSPVAPKSESTQNNWTKLAELPPEIKTAFDSRINSVNTKIHDDVAPQVIEESGESKSGPRRTDYDLNEQPVIYSDYYGWLTIYSIDSDEIWGPGWQFQEIFLLASQRPGQVHPYSVVVPMASENMGSVYWNGSGVEVDFDYTDENTGISGLKVTFLNSSYDWVWTGYEYQLWPASSFYFYRYVGGEENFFPRMVPADYAFVDGNGEGSFLGTYWKMLFGNEEEEPSTYSLTGTAYYDLNGNGTQDGGEPGIEGVSVALSTGANTTTDGSGNYSFADLEDGSYTVTVGEYNSRSHTTDASVSVTIDGADGSANFGFAGYTISGTVFYDLNGNGSQGSGEAGLGGQTVSNGGSTTTDGNGDYGFSSLLPGTYTVSMNAIPGYASTTGLSQSVTISAADGVADFGFGINLGWFDGGSVSGVHGMGWWKENTRKAIQGQVRGIQISAAALESLRASLFTFAYPVLNYPNLTATYNALNYSGGNAASKMIQHFTAAEYNFANGALVNGNAQATWALMVWGEYVATNAGTYSVAYLNAVKDLFEHFNGGELEIPDPLN